MLENRECVGVFRGAGSIRQGEMGGGLPGLRMEHPRNRLEEKFDENNMFYSFQVPGLFLLGA